MHNIYDKSKEKLKFLKPIGMMAYPNIYECVFDDMKIDHYRFQTFTETL